MNNTALIFENTLLAKKSEDNENLISDLIQSLSKDENFKAEALANELLAVLERLDLLDTKNCTALMRALLKAGIYREQEQYYSYLSEMELLRQKIESQKARIKNELSRSFYALKNELESCEFPQALSALDEALLGESQMLDILKETAESAFITTLEKGDDVGLLSSEIAKQLVYNAICEGDFRKERILKSSQIILSTAFELANESKNYAKELCSGAVRGVQEGIMLGIEKFSKSFEYASVEENLQQKEKELTGIEDDFIALLKTQMRLCDEPASSILRDLLANELDTIFAKVKRLANESRLQLRLSLDELKKNPKIDDFSRLTQSKIQGFKKQMNELEKMASEKYKDLNIKEAKNLGISLFERAKNFIQKK